MENVAFLYKFKILVRPSHHSCSVTQDAMKSDQPSEPLAYSVGGQRVVKAPPEQSLHFAACEQLSLWL